jgi:DNA-binding transcriptional LysR family regulator
MVVDTFQPLASRRSGAVPCDESIMIPRGAITYHQLQTFVVVARTRNLTKAALELRATQPTVSLQLQSLRKLLGTALFERPGGQFRLTAAGERLRRYAEEALEGLRAMQQDVAVLKGVPAGALGVGVTFFAASHIMPRLPLFRAKFPDVDVQITMDLPEPLFSRLLSGSLDVVCCIKCRTPPALTIEILGQEEFAIIASPNHRLARRRRITPEELSDEPFVVSSVAVFRELAEAKLRAVGVTPRIVAEARNYDAVKDLVESNVGYSIHLKPLAAADVAAGRFVSLRFGGPPLVGEIAAVSRSRGPLSPLIGEFIRFVRADMEGPRRARSRPKPSRVRGPVRSGRRRPRTGSRDH